MQKFTVTGASLRLGIGALVGLDRGQYKDRAHNLKPSEIPGIYETLQPIEFKKGEVIAVSPDHLSRADRDALAAAQDAPEEAEKPARRKRGKSADAGDSDESASD